MPRLTAIESDDPEFHRKRLKKFIAYLKRWDRKYGANYEVFVRELLKIFGDNPPITWRFLVTTYEYPAFRVVNRQSGRSTYFLRLPEDRIIIPHHFFLQQFRRLFPIDNGFYNSADEVIVDFAKFGPRKQREYLDAIKEMLDRPEMISLNFGAY
ncbi:MAG: hypothetical protein WEF53_01785 [Bacteroidota bacterium]